MNSSILLNFLRPDWLTESYWIPSRGSQLAYKYKYVIIGLIILYIPLLYIGQHLMKNRSPFNLKKQIYLWNLILSLLSLFGMAVMLLDSPIFFRIYFDEKNYKPATRAVVAIFTLTKVIEFGDTIFLVMKNKPLAFLHVYHHLTVALYCWHAQAVNVGFAHTFVFVNLFIHSIMYFYYAVSVISPKNQVLRNIRPFITMGQTLQMFVGMYISYHAIVSNSLPEGHLLNARFALLMYTSYAYLFGKFYIENYFKKLRPLMTLFVVAIHMLAMAGAYMLLHSNRWLRLLCELTPTYVLTATLVYLLQDYSSYLCTAGNESNLHKLISNESKLNELAVDEFSKEFVPDKYREVNTVKNGNFTQRIRHCCSFKNCVFIVRICLMLLNSFATWACETQTFRRCIELNNLCLEYEKKNSNSNFDKILKNSELESRDDNNEIDCDKKNVDFGDIKRICSNVEENQGLIFRKDGRVKYDERQGEMLHSSTKNSSLTNNCMERKKKRNLSLLGPLLVKIETDKVSECNKLLNSEFEKNQTLEKDESRLHNSERKTCNDKVESHKNDKDVGKITGNSSKTSAGSLISLPSRNFDYWFALMSFSIPAIYTFNVYGDLLLGICVHGALRWIIELHTAGALTKQLETKNFSK